MAFGHDTEFTKSTQGHYIIENARNYFCNKYKYLWKDAKTPDQEHVSKSNLGLLAIKKKASVTEYRGTWGIFDVIKTGQIPGARLGRCNMWDHVQLIYSHLMVLAG